MHIFRTIILLTWNFTSKSSSPPPLKFCFPVQAISKKKSASKKGQKKKSGKKSRDSDPTLVRREVTMFDAPAVENLYYIAHNAPDALAIRGFRSPVAGGKKTKKKKGKKGKKR